MTALVAKQTGLVFAGPAGESGFLHRPRFADSGAVREEDEVALATRFRSRSRFGGRAPAGALAPALRRAHRPRLSGLRPADGRPGPGRQRRPDEGRQALRPDGGRAPGVVRGALDPRRDSRVRAAQLAPGEGRDHQVAAQAVLQPAQDEEEPGMAVRGRDHGRRPRSRASTSADVREMEQRLSARDMSFDPTPESDEEDGAIRLRCICPRATRTPPSRSSARSGRRTRASASPWPWKSSTTAAAASSSGAG